MKERSFCREAQDFIDKVMGGDDQYHLLLGGAGTGKTTVSSRLMRLISETGYKVVSLYPTHASKFVAIEKLRKEVGDITIDDQLSDFSTMEEDDACVILPSGSSVEFRTIHSLLGLKLRSRPGKTGLVAKQDMGGYLSTVIGLKTLCDGAEGLVCFVDEVSMMPLPFITDEELTKDHMTITEGGLVQLLDRTKLNYRLIFTGDFKQLVPVKAPMSEFAEHFMKKYVPTTTLTVNHRSSSQEIVKLGEWGFSHSGRLNKEIVHPSITRVKDKEEFTAQYISSLLRGEDTVALVYTNSARRTYENLAAAAVHGKPNPIFEGNTVLSGATKTARVQGESKIETVLYSQERVKILHVGESHVIPDTAWSDSPVSAPMVLIQRLMDLSEHSFYGVMSVGEKVSPAFSEYTKEVGQAYRKVIKFGKDNPEHEYEELVDHMVEFNKNLSFLFTDHEELFLSGSKFKPYYNKNWSWNPEVNERWSSESASAGVAAFLWAKFYASVENKILPLKTVVAQTCHTAQGSGRDHVFIDMKDIRKCRTVEERRRLVYVACTRAKETLTILE